MSFTFPLICTIRKQTADGIIGHWLVGSLIGVIYYWVIFFPFTGKSFLTVSLTVDIQLGDMVQVQYRNVCHSCLLKSKTIIIVSSLLVYRHKVPFIM